MSHKLRTWTAIWPQIHTVFSHILHRSLHWQATSPKAITGFQPTSPKAYPPIITGLGLSTTNNHNHKPLLIEHLVSEGGHFGGSLKLWATIRHVYCLHSNSYDWHHPLFLVQTSRTSWSWRYLPSGEGRFQSHVAVDTAYSWQFMVDGESCFKISSPPKKIQKYVSRFPAVVVFLGGRYLLSTSLTVGSLTISEQAELVLGENLELQTRAIWVKGLRGSEGLSGVY